MISVRCDIGKSNFDVFLGGKHFKFENKKSGIDKFISQCKKHEISRIVLEPTCGYERNLLKELHFHGFLVSVVNPRYVRRFAESGKDLAKTDKIDAKILSEYGEKMDPKLYERKEGYRFDLEELTNRRDNLVCIQKEEKQRLEKEPCKIIDILLRFVIMFIMNALSLDLRKRVMEYVDSGHSYREASIYFSINESSVYRWSKLRKATGSLKVVLVSRSPHKLPDKELLEYIEKHPDAYLREIADHFKCGITTVHDALRRNAITYKKTKNIQGERSSEARRFYQKHKGYS